MSPRPAGTWRPGSRTPEAHIEWLKLIDVSGPFLSVPVLTAEWPDLEPLDGAERDRLRRAHGDWQASGDRLATGSPSCSRTCSAGRGWCAGTTWTASPWPSPNTRR